MKTLLTTIALFVILLSQAQGEITREFDGVVYELKHEEIRNINGKKYKDTFWVELGVESPRTKTILCRIPEKCRDIKIETINLNCIKDEISS